jgi:hypothetical protein
MVSIIHFITFALRFADVAKLVDALDLGSSALRCVGSSPSIRTQDKKSQRSVVEIFLH